MIAGALLVGAGFIGLLVSSRTADEVDPAPDDPIELPALRLEEEGIATPGRQKRT